MLFFYRFLINLIILLSPIIITYRLIKKKENLFRFKEKFGFFTKKRSKGKILWFHGASVGELQSVIPILEKLNNSKDISQILITSNTISSSEVISNIKLKKISHQFFPIDNNQIVKRFINYWRPSLAVFIDSEIWPNMILELDKRKIPSILLNARITKKSFNRWYKLKKFSKKIFSKFHICLSANKETVFFLRKLGSKKIKYFGNLKYSQSETYNIQLSTNLKKFFSKKKVWCASSTHNTEEKLAGQVHNKLKKKYKNLLTVIIPRHVERTNEISSQLIESNLKIHTHSTNEKIKKNTDIYLVNSFGKTKSFYSIINHVFLGGSIVNHGGQNPLEAVRYNCNIIHGPNISNFNEIYRFLNNQKISIKVKNLNQIVFALDKLFSSKKQKKNIKNIVKSIGKKILEKNLNEIKLILKKE